jgi:hypothetical protein
VDDLIAFLRARLDEIERTALAASQPTFGFAGPSPGGEHWQWVHRGDLDPFIDQPVELGQAGEMYTGAVSLRSVEKYPSIGVGPLPHFVIDQIEQVEVAVARHIIRHDPAAVLAEVDAKRRMMAGHVPGPLIDESDGRREAEPDSWDEPWRRCLAHDWVAWPCETMRLLALPHAGHPDYREEWRP